MAYDRVRVMDGSGPLSTSSVSWTDPRPTSTTGAAQSVGTKVTTSEIQRSVNRMGSGSTRGIGDWSWRGSMPRPFFDVLQVVCVLFFIGATLAHHRRPATSAQVQHAANEE